MKTRLALLFVLFCLALPTPKVFAADTNDLQTDLKNLVDKVQAKLKGISNPTVNDLTEEFKAFDALLVKHKGDKPDDLGQVLYLKGSLYMNFDDAADALAAINQIKRDYPDSAVGKSADKIIEEIKRREAVQKIQASLAVGKPFPAIEEKDLAGKPLSTAAAKGKVLLVYFWATWNAPSVAEAPGLAKTYEQHHGDGFEIIGISLDPDAAKVAAFTKEKNLPWQQYCDGQAWTSRLSVQFGVIAALASTLPINYLVDAQGNILAKNLHGAALEEAVSKALPKK